MYKQVYLPIPVGLQEKNYDLLCFSSSQLIYSRIKLRYMAVKRVKFEVYNTTAVKGD